MVNQQIDFTGEKTLLYITQLIYTEVNKYVKKVDGKGLSENDFTTTLKNKLDGIDLSQYSTTKQMEDAIADAIKDIAGIKIEKYNSFEELPTTGKSGVIYMIPKTQGTTHDVSDEYFWDGAKYEYFGTTEIDLSDYLKEEDLVEISQEKVKAIWDSVFTS